MTRELETADDFTLWLAGYSLASATDSLRAARRFLERLAGAADRSEGGRARGQIHLAHLEVGRGRCRTARLEFDRAGVMKPAVAFASRAWLAALPFLARPEAELAALLDSLRDWQPPAPGSNAWRVFGARIPGELRPWVKEYVLGLLSARLGEVESAERHAHELERAVAPPDSVGLRSDLAREIRALTALEAGRPGEALALLEGSSMAIAKNNDVFTPLYRRPLGRFLRAEILQQLGHDEEALDWYDTFDWLVWGIEYVFLAPVYLRQAEIHERREERERAIELYRRFVARWQDADAEYQPLVDDVKSRIARLAAEPAGD